MHSASVPNQPFFKRYFTRLALLGTTAVLLPAIGISFSLSDSFSSQILVVLGWTLPTLGILLLVLHRMTTPVRLAQQALETYLFTGQLPALPEAGTDEAGLLLRDMQATLESLDQQLKSQKEMIRLIDNELRKPAAQAATLLRYAAGSTDLTEYQLYCSQVKSLLVGQLRAADEALALAQNQLKGVSTRTEHLPLFPLIEAVLRQLDPILQKKGIAVDVRVAADTIVYVEQYPFTRVLKHLIENAAAHSPLGGLISILAQEENEQILLTIDEEGLGLEDGSWSHWFRHFLLRNNRDYQQQVDLYACKQAIAPYGGSITVVSKAGGEGTAFMIALPPAKAVHSVVI